MIQNVKSPAYRDLFNVFLLSLFKNKIIFLKQDLVSEMYFSKNLVLKNSRLMIRVILYSGQYGN